VIDADVAERSPGPRVREYVTVDYLKRAAQIIVPQLRALGIAGAGDAWLAVRFEPMSRWVWGRCRIRRDVAIVALSTAWLYAPGPLLTGPLDRALLRTFVHELLHALDRCESGHAGRWRAWAELVGLRGPGRDDAGSHLERIIDAVFARLGRPAMIDWVRRTARAAA